jgi:hypothetical protein
MGLFFRKSKKINKWLNLNFSKNGVRPSVGPKGCKISPGIKGIRLNIGKKGMRFQKAISFERIFEFILKIFRK